MINYELYFHEWAMQFRIIFYCPVCMESVENIIEEDVLIKEGESYKLDNTQKWTTTCPDCNTKFQLQLIQLEK